MVRSCVLFVVAALLLASCGFTRSEAVVVREGGEAADPNAVAADDPNAEEALVDPETGQPLVEENGPPPTALAPIIEIPSKGAADAVAATVEFDDGEVVEITFGEIDDIVQPSIASAQYRVLGELAPTFDAQILNLLIFSRSMNAEIVEQGIEVSEANLAEASEALITEVAGLLSQQAGDPEGDRTEEAEELFEDVPHMPLIVEASAQQTALVEHFAATAVPEEVPCVSHILVTEEQEAIDLVEELEGGADFAELAEESSIDETSGIAGGVLGCARPADFIEPAFIEAISGAELNEVTGPVETPQGWHVVLVTEFATEEVEPDALGARQFEEELQGRVSNALIEVDSSIGSWDTESSQLVPAGS